MVDGYGMVPEGKAGTGEAFVLPNDTLTPLQVIEQNRIHREKKDAALKEEQNKTMDFLDKSLKTPFDRDVPYLSQLRDKMVDLHAYNYKNNTDPLDMKNPEYWNLRKVRETVKDKFAISNTHYKQYLAANEELNKHPEKFDVDAATTARELWANLPLEERMKTPMPGNNAFVKRPDLAKEYNDFAKTGLPDPTQTASFHKDSKTNQIVNTEVKEYTPIQKALVGRNARMNPAIDEDVQTGWKALAEGDRQMFEQQASSINAELLKSGSADKVSGVDIYSSGKFAQHFNRTENISTHNLPEGGTNKYGNGWSEDDYEGHRILQGMSGIFTGFDKIYNPEELKYSDGIDPEVLKNQGAKPGDKFRISNSFANAQYGTVETNVDGERKNIPNIVTAWKYMNGKLYVNDTKAHVSDEFKKSGWRPINNLWGEMIEPYVRSNFGAKAGQILNSIEWIAKTQYGVDLRGGYVDPKLIMKIINNEGNDKPQAGKQKSSTKYTGVPQGGF